MANLNFEERWLAAAKQFTSSDPSDPPPPPPPPANALFAVNSTFDPNTLNTEHKAARQACINLAKLRWGGTYGNNEWNFASLYQNRRPKELANAYLAGLLMTGDVEMLECLYVMYQTMQEVNAFVTNYRSLTLSEYNGLNNKSLPYWTTQNLGSPGNQWGPQGYINLFNNSSVVPGATRKAWANNDQANLLKILYTNLGADTSSTNANGSDIHTLDESLTHGYTAKMGYAFDVNRALDPKYAAAADFLYDYFFNHFLEKWKHRTSITITTKPGETSTRDMSRSSSTGDFRGWSGLQHAYGTRVGMFFILSKWKELPHRGGTADPQDVLAYKEGLRRVLKEHSYAALPSAVTQIANPTNYEICVWPHQNEDSTARRGSTLPAYQTEHLGEMLLLHLMGVTDTAGNGVSERFMKAASLSFGFIWAHGKHVGTHAGTISGSNGAAPGVAFVAATLGSPTALPVFSSVPVAFGGSSRTTDSTSGFRANGFLGGWLAAFDPTPEKFSVRMWRHLHNNNYANRSYNMASIIADNNHSHITQVGNTATWFLTCAISKKRNASFNPSQLAAL